MLDRDAVLALSRSAADTPFLERGRLEAFERLRALTPDPALFLPDSLPLGGDPGVGGLAFSVRGDQPDAVVAGGFASFSTDEFAPTVRTLFEARFGTLALAGELDPAALRHRALCTSGFFVHVPDGVQAGPLKLSATAVHPWTATHLVIVVGKGATASLVEDLRNDRGGIDRSPSGGARGFWSHVVEIFLEEGARLEYVCGQRADPGVRLWVRQRSSLAASARLSVVNASIGGGELSQDLRSHLLGSHAVSETGWLFFAKGNEKQSLSARNIFDARDGGGEITMRGVAEDRASIGCDGMIEIGPRGSGTDTYLTQEVLMLDPTARVNAVPGLEIKTNDVKASHSATVTRVTEEDLFYFASRGIATREARRMYVQGFLADLASRISDPDERAALVEAVERKYDRVGA